MWFRRWIFVTAPLDHCGCCFPFVCECVSAAAVSASPCQPPLYLAQSYLSLTLITLICESTDKNLTLQILFICVAFVNKWSGLNTFLPHRSPATTQGPGKASQGRKPSMCWYMGSSPNAVIDYKWLNYYI